MPKPFFITCAIDYPNAQLHMGHVYEKTIADVIARAHRLNGEKVLFTVGSDEHGEKVAQSAKAAGLSPQAYVDHMSADFQKLMDLSLISYDRFVRTTDKDHIAAAQHFFTQLWEADDIYPDMYEGWYCVSDETFWTEKDTIDKAGKKFCPNAHCGKELSRVKEESYFFKWSSYQKKLEEWYAENPVNVFPTFRKNEMAEFMKKGLRDISFSRKSITWGIPIPQNPEHVMYVWSDALVNYLTVCGYPDKKYVEWWPASVHVIGMDINRFHSLLWPAMLMSAKVELPHQILVHGFVNDEKGEKMSKSTGNVVDPVELISAYGMEAIRYYLLKETPLGNDLSFSEARLIETTNADLADGLGNWVYRVLSMLEKYCNGVVPPVALDNAFVSLAEKHSSQAYAHWLAHDIHSALGETWKIVALGNKSISDTKPWELMKQNKREEVEKLLATQVELINRVRILVSPILPQTEEKIRAQFGFDSPAFGRLNLSPNALHHKKIQKGAVLFAKRELPAVKI